MLKKTLKKSRNTYSVTNTYSLNIVKTKNQNQSPNTYSVTRINNVTVDLLAWKNSYYV